MALKYNTQPLTAWQAAHLLRRASFGPTPALINEYTGLTPSAAVAKLLVSPAKATTPIDPATGKTFTNKPFVQEMQGKYTLYVKQWWLASMVSQPASLIEKMTLFLQNHLVVSTNTIADYRYMYDYHSLLRKYALGNFKTLILEITSNPAMLRYLNGNQNSKSKPNENYARELQELFTIGRVKQDGTSNYNEEDVKTAARVLTGWVETGYRDTINTKISSAFDVTKHDTGDKIFSSYYQNTIIIGRNSTTAGSDELNDLVNMIFNQIETSKNICRELYRFFVRADISNDTEINVITELATIFRNSNFNLRPVLTALFKSQHFYDTNQVGAVIKSPIDLVVGTLRYFELQVPNMSTLPADFYTYAAYIHTNTREQQQEVLTQPTVFGWPPYYDTGMYKTWINTTTLSYRSEFVDDLVLGRFRIKGIAQQIDTISWAQKASIPSDPVVLVNEITANLFAVALPQLQKDYIIDNVLIPGLPRIEWTIEWNSYIANPTDTKKTRAVRNRLNDLFSYLMRMAEYEMI